jgi:hypothetical protein
MIVIARVLCILGCVLAPQAMAEPAPVSAVSMHLQIPKKLRPYADVEKTRDSLTKTLSILSTVVFEDEPKGIDEKCNTAKIISFYRGMQLTHSAFYFFASIQELGWPEHENPAGNVYRDGNEEPKRALVSWGRGILLKWIDVQAYANLIYSADPAVLSSKHRQDLKEYLTVLLGFRNLTLQLESLPRELSEIERRSTDSYRYAITDGYKKKVHELPDELKPLEYWREIGKLISRMQSMPHLEIENCLDINHSLTFQFGSDNEIKKRAYLMPIKYMVTFWRRRMSEGTDALAGNLIEKTIQKLD